MRQVIAESEGLDALPNQWSEYQNNDLIDIPSPRLVSLKDPIEMMLNVFNFEVYSGVSIWIHSKQIHLDAKSHNEVGKGGLMPFE
jgi:hypothetical protein